MSAEPIKDTPAAEPAAATTTEATPVTEATPATTEATVAPTSEAPIVETKPEVASATPVAAAELPKEEKVSNEAVKIEAQPIAAGNLGYKAPGLLK